VAAAGGVWRDVSRLSEVALAQQIRQDEIDVLVELTGACWCQHCSLVTLLVPGTWG
jgi:predicted O-linked N-acetylglucosamine transferase (SPINDLY family)